MKPVVVLGLLLLSGCADPVSPLPDNESDEKVESTGTVAQANEPVDTMRPERIFWTDCRGLFSEFTWPLDTAPGSSFPGWEPSEGGLSSSVDMMAWECNRFNFGSIERGPIRFLIEFHNYFSVPEGCRAERGPIFYWIISSIWVDDPEVASILGASEGMPAYAASIDASDEATTGLPTRTWTWSAEGFEPSSMSIVQEMESSLRFPKLPSRWYWQNELDGISFMDVPYDALGAVGPPGVDAPAMSQRPMTGTMREPMLMAALGEDYTGFGTMLEEGQFEGTIARYGDMACGQPV